MENNLIIAAAGSGKTTYLVKEALRQKDHKVLITTYTQANEAEIKKKIIELNKCIPEHITVQTWFSFLLKHGVRPFQGILYEKKIRGLLFVSGQSGLKATTKHGPVYFSEDKEFENHYFTNAIKIYSDKLAKLVYRCNEKTQGAVMTRLSRIYGSIFIDEVQDLAGYDLELLNLLFKCPSRILMVGDPRQGTYSTSDLSKNKQFKRSEITHFFEDPTLEVTTDNESLLVNYRCNTSICDLSNRLFLNFPAVTSGNDTSTGHDGIFFIKEQDVDHYLGHFTPVQLRDSKRKNVNEKFSVMNFGESKGLSFDRILIYPTKPFLDWLKNNSSVLAPTSRSKLYVALTRARYSIGIVHNYNDKKPVEGIIHYTVPELGTLA